MPEPRRSCPQCGGTYPSNAEFCTLDGTALTSGDTDVLIGRTIGRYEITERIGEGGMARLYRAKHTFLNQDFAIKILFGELAASTQLVNRFHREAQTVSQIKHPHVVQTVDFGKTDAGLSFMVMEYIEGIPLSRYLRKNNPLPLKLIATIAKQIAGGLSAAHAQGFVHRDLKPGNIMIEERAEGVHAKILDFGLVHLKDPGDDDISKLTKTGQILGTPAYMAPEQISSTEITPQTDLYSLGIVIYELITGRPPFSGTMSAVMNQHLFESIPNIASAGGLEQLANRLLEKKPSKRPDSAQEVVNIIESLEVRGELDYVPKARQLGDKKQNEVTTANVRGDRVGTAETQTSLADLAGVTPRSKSIGLLAGAIFLLAGAVYFYAQTPSSSVEKISVPPPAAPTVAKEAPKASSTKKTAQKKVAKRPAKPKRQAASVNKKTAEAPDKSVAKPKTKETNKPEQKEKTPAGNAASGSTSSGNNNKPRPNENQAPSKTPEPVETPKKTQQAQAKSSATPTNSNEGQGSTETIVEVDIDPPSGPAQKAKENPDSVGSIAKAHRDDSSKKAQDAQLLKEKLAALDRKSSGQTKKTPKQQAEEFKEKAINAIADKRLVWAEIELGRCLDLDRKNSDCNKLMAVVRERKRDYLGAVKYYQLYLQYTPQAPDRTHVLSVIEKLKQKR